MQLDAIGEWTKVALPDLREFKSSESCESFIAKKPQNSYSQKTKPYVHCRKPHVQHREPYFCVKQLIHTNRLYVYDKHLVVRTMHFTSILDYRTLEKRRLSISWTRPALGPALQASPQLPLRATCEARGRSDGLLFRSPLQSSLCKGFSATTRSSFSSVP